MSGAVVVERSPPMAANGISAAPHARAVLWTFVVTLFVSAFLLFSVQPLFAKLALPKFGGAPSVWAVSMCFFQAALLAGYCYAYALIRWCPPIATVAVHATVMLITLVVLPIGLPTGFDEPPSGNSYVWLLGALTAGVGLPFFAVSANAPLLQAWFARTGHPDARDPYFLYGASNAGSLLALLAYPTAIEPLIGLRVQSQIWSGGFALLAVLLMASAAWMLARGTVPGGTTERDARSGSLSTSEAPSPALSDRLTWIGLAALPSALLVAVTTHITTDLVSAPLFWVVPLALFLATFIVVFREREIMPIDVVSRALPLLLVAMLSLPSPWMRLAAALAGFVAAALLCHRLLYLRRPKASHLTDFYLCMSLGGTLGGIFSALLAPQIFPSAFEFTALMIAALFCRPDVIDAVSNHLNRGQVFGAACLAASALILDLLAQELGGEWAGRGVMAIVLGGLSVHLWRTRTHPAHSAGVMVAIGLFAAMLPASQPAVHTARSFFGVVRVIETADGAKRIMQHGTTLHGSRRLKTADGAKVDHPIPATYYHPAAPLARGVSLARMAAAGGAGDAMSIGVVGLGTGSLACYAKPGDSLTYFEIDPVVVEIAQTPRYFDFLSQCRPDAKIVMGDARLSLAKSDYTNFDYLAIDAFSSDSVPVHLLTAEAIALYLGKLAPHGILAVHLSNRYMDLVTPFVATARTVPNMAITVVNFPGVANDPDAEPSRVVFIARDPKDLAAASAWPDARPPADNPVAPWTDDYSNIVAAMLRHY